MFERYTERARRVLFFARYEASQLGGLAIESEHLLLGLIREGKGLTARIFARARLPLEQLRKEIEGRTVVRDLVSTSVEIPFSAETKRILQRAADEADGLHHAYIGTEHLLLGVLREDRSVAASILIEHGMGLQPVRDDVVQLLKDQPEQAGPHGFSFDASRETRDVQLARIDRLLAGVDRLAAASHDHEAAQMLRDDLQALRAWLASGE
jgi:ATP-dependent Clp protease ATP-binding subunit ClpC